MQAFKKILFFIAVLIVTDFVGGAVLRKIYFSQKSNQYFRTTYTLQNEEKQLVVLGSSRAIRHYSDSIFANGLNMTYYNGGADGEFLTYSYAMFHGITERYKPDLVILDITAHALSDLSFNNTNIASLRPYYSLDPFYKKLTYGFSFSEPIKNLSRIFPYNNKIFSILSGIKRTNSTDTIGFFPLQGVIDTNYIKNNKNTPVPNNPALVKMYNDFLKEAKAKEINLVVAISPVFYKPESAINSVKEIEAITKRNEIPFFDYSSDTTYLGKSHLFYDNEHLNKEGSLLFSKNFLEEIVKLRSLKTGK